MVTRRLQRRFLLRCVLTLFLFFILSTAVPAKSYELILAVGQSTTFSHFAGKRLCHAINRFSQGITCKTIKMETPIDVLTNIQSGSLDLALVNSKTIYDAFNSEGLFQFMDISYDNLRLLLPLYRVPVSLLVRKDSGIESFGDLYGKRVNGGGPLTMHYFIFQEVMQVMGWTPKSFSLYQTLSSAHAQDYLAFNNGSVQAMIHIGMHPDWKLIRQFSGSKSEIIAIDGKAVSGLAQSKSGYCMSVIEGGTYKEYPKDIKTLAVETFLITSADIDEETIALILEGIYAAKDHLQHTHPAFLKQKVDIEILNNSYLHPHPAATLFYQQYLHTL